MEITLEKIELVKDRTGASYKDAKDALEAADGNVVDAIIDIEENIDLKQALEPNCVGASLLDTLKGVIRKGNVSKVVVKRDGERLINLPVNAVIIGAALSPLGTIVGISAAFGFKQCPVRTQLRVHLRGSAAVRAHCRRHHIEDRKSVV